MHEGFVLMGGRGCYMAARGVGVYPPPRTLFVKRSQAWSQGSSSFTLPLCIVCNCPCYFT